MKEVLSASLSCTPVMWQCRMDEGQSLLLMALTQNCNTGLGQSESSFFDGLYYAASWEDTG